jgi:Glycosyltransferase family 87
MASRKTKLIIWLAAMVLIHLWLFWKVRAQLDEGYPDFTIFYTAGRIVKAGAGTHLYDSRLQFEIQRQFAPLVHIRQGPLPFNHPPFEAIIFLPFAFLSYSRAYLAWSCINLLILVLVIALMRAWLTKLSEVFPWYLWGLGCLGFFPVFIALVQGQDVILLLFFYALAFSALSDNRELACGCWLALGLIKPHLVLPTIFVLLLQKRKRAGLGFLCVAAVLALISVAVVRWKGFLNYPAYVWSLELSLGKAAIAPSVMPNIRGLICDVSRQTTGTLMLIIVLPLSLALLIFAAGDWRRPDALSSRNLRGSLVLIASILASYHAYAYDLSLLILPILWISECAQENKLRGSDRITLLGPIFILFFTPFYLLLLLRIDHFSAMALVLTLWFFAIRREIRREIQVPLAPSACTSP